MLKFFESLFRLSRQRETYNQLMKLSDHELADIGISRSEITSIAYEIKD